MTFPNTSATHSRVVLSQEQFANIVQKSNRRVAAGENDLAALSLEFAAATDVSPLMARAGEPSSSTPSSSTPPSTVVDDTPLGRAFTPAADYGFFFVERVFPTPMRNNRYVPYRVGDETFGAVKIENKHNIRNPNAVSTGIRRGSIVADNESYFDFEGVVVDRISQVINGHEITLWANHEPIRIGSLKTTRSEKFNMDTPDGKPMGVVTAYCPDQMLWRFVPFADKGRASRCPDWINSNDPWQ